MKRPPRPVPRSTTSHPFEARPHRTLLAMSLPVMLSLIAEPVAGLVDTAFVERLGAPSAAALGAATALLSSFLWIFNFLGVGTQTEVARVAARSRGAGEAREVASLAMMLALGLGTLSAALLASLVDVGAAWMSADSEVREATRVYLALRLIGFPAGLVLLVCFGVLRGLQDMKTPMWIAAGMSLANVGLDAVLIFGAGPVPAFGIAGAAWATVVSQVLAAAVACAVVVARLGWSWQVERGRMAALFVVGRDMVIRTSALLVFMLIATRVALQMGPASGAAHQAIRQIWILLAFVLDAYAASAQSLVAWFLGSERPDQARRVAGVAMAWALGTGVLLSLALWLAEPVVASMLVPPEARAVFASAWPVFALSQPLNAVSFLTDGVHWGTSDFAWLRNGMLVSSVLGLGLLSQVEATRESLAVVWMITLIWISVRAVFGTVRIWPGLGRAPLTRVR